MPDDVVPEQAASSTTSGDVSFLQAGAPASADATILAAVETVVLTVNAGW